MFVPELQRPVMGQHGSGIRRLIVPYEIGERVIVNLQGLVILGVDDLGSRTEAAGTVVDKPGGVLYHVSLDQPLSEGVDRISFVGGSRLRSLAA
jgi:hypothetical protein